MPSQNRIGSKSVRKGKGEGFLIGAYPVIILLLVATDVQYRACSTQGSAELWPGRIERLDVSAKRGCSRQVDDERLEETGVRLWRLLLSEERVSWSRKHGAS